MVGAGVLIGTAIVFLIFGSTEIQPWNTPKGGSSGIVENEVKNASEIVQLSKANKTMEQSFYETIVN